jgi:integrase
VRDRKIPASPCAGIRVNPGGIETGAKQVATPVQFMRAALRMDDLMGYPGFVLTLMNGYTGARWSELISQKPDRYDQLNHQIPVRRPIREARGQIEEAPRPQTRASKRWIQLPPFLALLYEHLIDTCPYRRTFTGARSAMLRRSNFSRRFWRPTWDGDPDNPNAEERTPAIRPGFTFHEGRHTHRTWLADDRIPDVARAARLGHKLPGMADVYEHVTPAMQRATLEALQARWHNSIEQLTEIEQAHLRAVIPPKIHLEVTQRDRQVEAVERRGRPLRRTISNISPATA